MYQPHHELFDEAADVYLQLVPSLSEEIAAEMSPGYTTEEWDLVRRQVTWAAMASAASRLGLTAAEFAAQVLRLRDVEKSLSYWQAANAAIKPTS